MAERLNLLLDTRVLLWWLGGSNRLSEAARKTIVEGPAVYVSAATAWEIAPKVRQGKLALDGDLREQMIPADKRLNAAGV